MILYCEQCGQAATARVNPFYGTGLSVHEFIVECSACARTDLKSGPSSDIPEAGHSDRDSWWRRASERIVHILHSATN